MYFEFWVLLVRSSFGVFVVRSLRVCVFCFLYLRVCWASGEALETWVRNKETDFKTNQPEQSSRQSTRSRIIAGMVAWLVGWRAGGLVGSATARTSGKEAGWTGRGGWGRAWVGGWVVFRLSTELAVILLLLNAVTLPIPLVHQMRHAPLSDSSEP